MDPSTWSAGVAEQGDSSSTEEVESPRSVVTAAAMAAARRGTGRWSRWRKRRDFLDGRGYEKEEKKGLHNQVVRIKEEELKISEDLRGDYYSSYDCVADCHPVDDIWSRTNLPASPLGSKNY